MNDTITAPRKIPVLLLALNSSVGGTEKMVLELAAGLDRSRFEPCICTLVGDGTLVREAIRRGMPAYDLEMSGPLDIRILPKLLRLLRERDIAVLHTFLYHANILGRLLGRYAKIPVIISTQRSTDPWRTWYHRLADRWTAGLADAIISNSQSGKERLTAVERIAGEKISVVRNGIRLDVDAALRRGAEVRQLRGIGSGDIIIGTVANLKEAKGLETLIDAVAILQNDMPDARAMIVGHGPLLHRLRARVRRRGMTNRIIFAGLQADAVGYCAAFDLYVQPSRWEGTPVALMEAMALGKPVIASAVGGIPEIVADGKDGMLVPAGRPDELSAAIAALINDPARAAALGKSAREKMEREFTVKRMVHETERIYDALIAPSPKPSPARGSGGS
ncbi:MAG TPA: glycosyltransferase [bacterium]|nr:glycosyltransferase [bacterium]